MTDGTPTPAPTPTPTPTPSAAAGALDGNLTPTPTPTPTPSADLLPGDVPHEWMRTLPPELQSDKTLARFNDPASLAKGYLETREWAKGRVALPKADSPDSFNEFAAAIRPVNAADYEVAVPEGMDDQMAAAFRERAFDLGLHPLQAKGLAEWNNDFMAKQQAAMQRAATEELTSMELEIGPQAWARGTEAVTNMLAGAGVEIADVVPALEQVAGAGKAMQALFKLAERTGEMGKVDPTAVSLRTGAMSPEQAQAEINAMFADKEKGPKLRDPASAEYKQYEQLLKIVQAKR